jgi:hypothetical protein
VKLKLSAIPDDKPVRLTVELPAAVHRDLMAYAEVLGRLSGQAVEPAKLVAPMLARFMSTDRAFASAPRKANDKVIPRIRMDRGEFRDDVLFGRCRFAFTKTRAGLSSSSHQNVLNRSVASQHRTLDGNYPRNDVARVALLVRLTSILNSQPAGLGQTAIDSEHQCLAEETESARTSNLFAATSTRLKIVNSTATNGAAAPPTSAQMERLDNGVKCPFHFTVGLNACKKLPSHHQDSSAVDLSSFQLGEYLVDIVKLALVYFDSDLALGCKCYCFCEIFTTAHDRAADGYTVEGRSPRPAPEGTSTNMSPASDAERGVEWSFGRKLDLGL